MRIALMPHVENDFILRNIENIVERHGKFHHAEVGGKVSAVIVSVFDDLPPYVRAKRFQLFHVHFFQLRFGKDDLFAIHNKIL